MTTRCVRANDELHLVCLGGEEKGFVFPDAPDQLAFLFPETKVTLQPRCFELEIFHNIVPEQKAWYVEVSMGGEQTTFGLDFGRDTRLLNDLPVGLWIVVQQIPIYTLPQAERQSTFDWQIPALQGDGAILPPWLMPKLSMLKPRRTILNRSIR
jgi:hypothetical protein